MRGKLRKVLRAISPTGGVLRRRGDRRSGTRDREQDHRLDVSEARFRLFVDSVRDYAIFMLDPDGRVETWNQGAERIKGWRADEVVGRHFSIFYTEADREVDHPAHELEIVRREGRYEEEGWRVRKDGSLFWAAVTITAVRDRRGRLEGFGKVTRDLSERKEAEEALRRSKQKAEAASEAKSEFLATMSHELRTPLNAILGYVELLAVEVTGPLNDAQREQLRRIQSAGRQLLLLIDQVLSLSRIEAREEELHVAEVDPGEVAREVLSLVLPACQARGIEATVDVEPGIGTLRTDPGRLHQILTSLIANAEKFTETGDIGIRVRPADEGGVRFEVWDTGIGVRPEDRERIFERFTQSDQSRTRRYGGAGLGLSIARAFARLLGGDVTLESEPGAGSTFTLRLPPHPPVTGRDFRKSKSP